mgnify:CR=1 FL=1
MCSRYEINTTSPEHISLRFRVNCPSSVDSFTEVRPTDRAPIIKSGGQVKLLRWGLKNTYSGQPLINARSETLSERKTFIPLLENRCLVPASAYFEWRKNGAQNIKSHIARKD